jgi:hypothetical protein
VSSPFTILSFAVGFAALAFYLIICARRAHCSPNLVSAIAFLSGGVGLPTAIRVWYLAIFAPVQELDPFTSADRLVMVLGGLALLWTFYAAVRDFVKSLPSESDED